MGSPWRKAFAVVLLSMALAACGSEKSPPSVIEGSSEEVRTMSWVFSEPQYPETKPAPEIAPSAPSVPQSHSSGLNKRYPPPTAPMAPMAPRGPPVMPRFKVEPPPSAVKPFPDFKVDSLGIWECDNYTAQYLSCINLRVHRNQDARLAKALAEKVRGWKAQAVTEVGRGEVVQECQAAMARTKKAMQPYKCLWQ